MPSQNLGLRMGGVSSAAFTAQSVFLLGSGCYSLMYPSSVAKLKGGSPNGTTKAIIQLDGLTSLALGLCYLNSIYEKRTRMMISFVSYHLLSDWAMYRNGRKWNPFAALETEIAVLAGAALIWDRYM
ncbi:hypothetical protein BJX68DRAFT_237140 [Aspergillus pseudodeflectus]|uniref:Uncharacterized protein n=1 Tax=Aspergillus pseudodeflectus TaxID=176178 RepID=A0ABR4KDU0_9EURO